ncbi:MAG: nucleotide exchange factor GrpE [Fibromonadaceae bacterium]|jgi:molecular chaperone GrpE|nr:nucleotide exchange factor GrpE [Fibromonadaceae bacterium]
MEENLEKNEVSEEVDRLVEEAESTSVEEIAKEASIAEAQEKEKIAQDKYLRLFAEFENYRTRSAKEQLELISTANGKLLEKLSEVKDNFDRAFAEENKTGDLTAFEKGIKLIQEQFNKILSDFGLETIDPSGEAFDPNMHEALMKQPSENVEEGKIIQVYQKGYKIKNKLLKTAKVIVSSGAA